MHDGYFFAGGFMWILWILLIVVVIWAVTAVAGGVGRSNQQAPKTALEILEERFARGEIGKEEFEEKKAALRK